MDIVALNSKLEEENERLSQALDYSRKRISKETRFVYVISCVDFIKVGIADKPEKRLASMQVGSPFELRIIAKYKSLDAPKDERRLHKALNKFRVRGEWFKIPDALIAMLVKAQTVEDLFDEK